MALTKVKNVIDITADTMSDLLSMEHKTGSVQLLGFHERGDGGGGVFYWDASEDCANHNGGTIIAGNHVLDGWTELKQTVWFTPTVGTGCWKREFSGAVNVKWFGAKGDGVTDDTKALKNVIEPLIFGEVDLPNGTFVITSTIIVDVSGLGFRSTVKVTGQGKSLSVIDNQSNNTAFKITSGTGITDFAYDFKLENLSITDTTSSANSIGITLEGSRFATLNNVHISGMGSHGIYGLSVLGDYTDTAQILINQCEILSCGGWGIYPASASGGIQYNWNIDQCRVGLNTLGGVSLESMQNCVISNTGIFGNAVVGVKVDKGTGTSPSSKIIKIMNCEFDTNIGVQLEASNTQALTIEDAYLIANNTSFTKGIQINSTVYGCNIYRSYPRMNPTLTGKIIHQFEAGCIDVVVRDTKYQAWSDVYGSVYVINEPGVVVDDFKSRNSFYTGTYTVVVSDSSGAIVSPTTVTGYYSVNGNVVSVNFRELNNLDLIGFTTQILAVSLPFACKAGSSYGAVGTCIITSDSGVDTPLPSVGNGGGRATFQRVKTNSFLRANELTSGVSDISQFSLVYIKS